MEDRPVHKSSMIIKRLTGHSGCQVLLCANEDGRKFVRKISSSADYNQRLLKQVKKQKRFDTTFDVKTPSILDQGTVGDLFYFDMEYVPGKLMSDCVNLLDIHSLEAHLKTIVCYLETDNSNCSDLTSSIEKKIRDLEHELPSRYGNYIKALRTTSWNSMPVGKCHGDFTLENMIVSNGKLFFIDFLDSFADTKLLDISKMLFDVRYFWSKRHLKRKAVVKSIFVENYITSTSLYKLHSDAINQMVILNILRMLPYCKDHKTLNYLEGCLKHASR